MRYQLAERRKRLFSKDSKQRSLQIIEYILRDTARDLGAFLGHPHLSHEPVVPRFAA